jgi:hypothetical protein
MPDYKCTSEMHKVCSNNTLCLLCDGIRLFKDPVAERRVKDDARIQKQQEKRTALLKTHTKEKKEGMAFEKRVQKTWNQTVSKSGQAKQPERPLPKPRISGAMGEARRQPNSGATWKAKGDIKLEHALMECKERGTLTAKGEKQIAIMKEWLDKMVVEAYKESRDYWYLPFGFKGSDDIFIVKPFDHEMQLIYELRAARERIEELEAQLGGNNDGTD